MSDEGPVSNAEMTYHRYTLGGNSFGLHVVDASGSPISSTVLDEAATVCLPLPNELRSNIDDLAMVAINSDGSLTILAGRARIGPNRTSYCGALSSLPATVAVGTAGAPAGSELQGPDPAPVLPDTGGTSPANGAFVSTLLAAILLITVIALAMMRGRNRHGRRNAS